MSRFTRFARHKFSADRHLKLFCTPGQGAFLNQIDEVLVEVAQDRIAHEEDFAIFEYSPHISLQEDISHPVITYPTKL